MSLNLLVINSMLEKSSKQSQRSKDKFSIIAKQMNTVSSTNHSHWCSYRLRKSLIITTNICRNISSSNKLRDAALEPKIQTTGEMVPRVHFHQTSSLILGIAVSTTSKLRKIQRHLKIPTKWVDIKNYPVKVTTAWTSKVKVSSNMGQDPYLWQVIRQIMSIQIMDNTLVVQGNRGKINCEAQEHFLRLMKLKDNYLK